MEELDYATLETTKPNYLNLLQEINKLSSLSTNLNSMNITEIETIFNNITKNIDRILDQMVFQKSSMFLITTFNIILRISTIDGSDLFISRQPFQSMFEKLNNLIYCIDTKKDYSPVIATDILDSILLNLVKDDFIEICFRRLLSNETATTEDSVDINEESLQEKSIEFHDIDANQDVELKSDGYHLSELLELLDRAFANTYVIKHILDDKINEKSIAIQYFIELFLSFYGALLDPEPDELEKRAVKYLLRILLQISSYPEYLKQLIDNHQFCIIIESLASRPKRDDAKRIWCNIQQIISTNEQKKERSSKIYISYDHTDEEFCKEFVNELRKRTTIPIWVDYEHVDPSDEMWEYVSPNIISATVIIILVSTAYGESTDKFQELSYIISTNKSRDETKGLIVVATEPNFSFNRSWMKDLLHDKTMVLYENNIDHMIWNQQTPNPNPIKSEKRKFFDEAVHDCIVTDGRPFGDFRRPGMAKLLNSCRVLFTKRGPVRKTIRRNVTSLYDQYREELRSTLAGVKAIAFTVDIWTKNETFESIPLVLGFNYFSDPHQADNIRRYIIH
ncbi:unnamed protein product [Adineta steineri]|uniref:TIR domain-containing protein n=1 Tax=Adineta steineri TaxID=433720 RepID=A0A819TMX1_9BILA|nr:unnamed protein product [Adineta steineri]